MKTQRNLRSEQNFNMILMLIISIEIIIYQGFIWRSKEDIGMKVITMTKQINFY